MKMTNIRINKIRDGYYTVVADTERFGKDEIMFEGTSRAECEKYIEREDQMHRVGMAIKAIETMTVKETKDKAMEILKAIYKENMNIKRSQFTVKEARQLIREAALGWSGEEAREAALA